MIRFAPCKVIRIPESDKLLLVESGILGFGVRNPSLPDKESRIYSVESRNQDYLEFTWRQDLGSRLLPRFDFKWLDFGAKAGRVR